MADSGKTVAGAGIHGLADLIKAAETRGEAPVDSWDPPYCGDIGLAIQADGSWLYRGSPIGRPALVKLFARVLRRDRDGRFYLVTPAEKVDVQVDDAPFLAVEMSVADKVGRHREIVFRTNVDDIVVCGRENPLAFREDKRGGLRPYLKVRGRLEALVVRSLTYDLLDLAEDDGSGTLGIRSGGAFFPVGTAG